MKYWRLFLNLLQGFFTDKYEVRGKLISSFIDEVLLPRIRQEHSISARDLVTMIGNFKREFSLKYDAELIKDFELVPSIELELLHRHAREPESLDLLQAVIAIGSLVDSYPELIRV